MNVGGHSYRGLMTNPLPTYTANEPLTSRPWKESLSEIAGASAVLVVLTYIILAAPGGGGSLEQVWNTAPIAGGQVLEHIGWGFGVYIPVLLAFYAIVIGGQLVESPAAAATRRSLGLVAQAMAAALAPALLLIIAAYADDLSKAGALVVILPATGITLFLAVQLGGFVIFEDTLKLAAATRTRDWAQNRFQALRIRGRRPLWLVQAVTAIVGGTFAFALTLCLASPTGPLWTLFLVYVMFTLGLTLFNTFGVQTLRTAQDRSSKIAAWLLPLSMGLIVTTIALNLFLNDAGAGGIAIISIVAFCTLSTLWPRSYMGRFWLNWSIQGAGTASAARAIVRRYVKAAREIRELTPAVKPDSPPTLRERILAAVQAFRAERLEAL